jgi:hypothetical protein
MKNSTDLKWSSKLEKISDKLIANVITSNDNEAMVENTTITEVDNIEPDIYKSNTVTEINNSTVIAVNCIKDNLLLKIKELEEIELFFNNAEPSEELTPKFQELKTSTNAKKSIMDTYIKVIDNISKNTLPVITKFPDNLELVKTVKSSLSKIIDGITDEIDKTQALISEVRKLNLIKKNESIPDEDMYEKSEDFDG